MSLPEELETQVLSKLDRNEWETGLLLLNEYIRTHKDDCGHALRLRGTLHVARGIPSLAQADFSKALETCENDADNHILKAKIELLKGKVSQALEEAEQAITSDPNSGEAYATRAYIRQQAIIKGEQLSVEFSELLDDWKKAIDSGNYKRTYLCHFNRACIYQNFLKDLNSAYSEYNVALEQNPNYLHAIKNRAILHTMEGRVNEAIQDYELAVSINNQDFESSFLLGVVYAAVAHNRTFLSAYPSPTSESLTVPSSERISDEQRSNYIELAIKNFKNALNYCLKDKKPEYWALTQEELALLYCERIAGQTGYNLEESIRHFKNALQVRTKDKFPLPWARIRNSLGTSFSRRQRGDKNYNLNNALTHYESALTVFTPEQNPFEYVAIKYNYSLTLKKAERFSDATQSLETSISLLKSMKEELEKNLNTIQEEEASGKSEILGDNEQTKKLNDIEFWIKRCTDAL